MWPRLSPKKFDCLLSDFLSLTKRTQLILRAFFEVIFLTELFVEYAILFVAQVDTAETIGASSAVEKESAIAAIAAFG